MPYGPGLFEEMVLTQCLDAPHRTRPQVYALDITIRRKRKEQMRCHQRGPLFVPEDGGCQLMSHTPWGLVTIPEKVNGMPDGICPGTAVGVLLGCQTPCILGLLESIAKLLHLPDTWLSIPASSDRT